MEKRLRETLPGGVFTEVSEQRSKHMASVKGRGNKSTEVNLRMRLIAAGIRGWKMHVKDVRGRPDFYFPHERVAVFVDGCFWHGCPRCGHLPKKNSSFWTAKIKRNRQRDAAQTTALRAEGIEVLRFWEHDLKEGPGACVQAVGAAVRARSGDGG